MMQRDFVIVSDLHLSDSLPGMMSDLNIFAGFVDHVSVNPAKLSPVLGDWIGYPSHGRFGERDVPGSDLLSN